MAKNKQTTQHKKETFSILPLWKRKWDLIFIIFYFTFTWSTLLIDIHNVLAPVSGLSVKEFCEKKPINWPPRFVTDIYMLWGEKVDPLLIENPVYFQIMEWINCTFLLVGNLIMLYAFIKGSNYLRGFGLIHASALFYSMILCNFGAVYGETIAVNIPEFLFIYSLYAIYPIVIMIRLWEEKPFSEKVYNNEGWFKRFSYFITTVYLIAFFMYCYHWLIVHFKPFADYPDWWPYFLQGYEKVLELKAKYMASA